MKKIALSLAVVATLAMVSCGNKAAENADTDSMVTEVAEEVVATDSDTTVAAAAATEEVAAPAADENKDAAKDAAKEEAPKADSANK